ncbi:MAG: DASS family sodium-coupled anion symporter [Campylobacterales bacterium]|nr:DASS family sodium-coupled anion symporter [Campylobacterales bacterium]
MVKEVFPIFLALLAGTTGFLVSFSFFTPIQAAFIAVLITMVVLWTNEGLPLGVVSLIPIIIFPFFNILPTNSTTANYSNPIIFLFLGGFLLAIATEKTKLHQLIATKILSVFPKTPFGIILSLGATSAFLSSMLSNTTTALLLIPIASFLTNSQNLQVRFILAIAYGASIGGIMTPIGTPPNMILLGFLQKEGLPGIGFIEWIVLVAPLSILILIISSYLLSFGIKKKEQIKELKDNNPLSFEQKRLLIVLSLLALLLLLNSPIEPYYKGLGLNESGILLGFGLLMFLPKIGFLKWSDTKKIPYEIIFLFGAGFSIAQAFSSTGLAGEFALKLHILSSLSPWALILIMCFIISFTTNITSNTALISIALPIVYAFGELSSIKIELLLLVTTISASYAFMLPIATPPNAIAMSTGVVKTTTMMKFGFFINIVSILVITLIAISYWDLML